VSAQRQDEPGRSGLSQLAGALNRRGHRPKRSSIGASIALHVAVVALLVAGGQRLRADTPEFRAYRVNLVSPPPQVEGERQPVIETQQIIAPPAAEQPAPTPRQQPAQQTPPRPQPAEQSPPRPAQQTPPAQQPPAPRPTQTPPPRPTETPPVRQPAPTAGNNPRPVQVGGDGINVRQEGLDFPYPEYLANVVRQIHDHFRWSGAGNLEAQVNFFILRDGTVGGIEIQRASGNLRFDLQATSAIEQVGQRGRFGALPSGWQQDRLWVSFRFLPPQ
jgi:periplasmic protein TonB